MRRGQLPAKIPPGLLFGRRDTVSTWLIQSAEVSQVVSCSHYGWEALFERGAVLGRTPSVPTLTPQCSLSTHTASPPVPASRFFPWRLGFLWQTSSLCLHTRETNNAGESSPPHPHAHPTAPNRCRVRVKGLRSKIPHPWGKITLRYVLHCLSEFLLE